MKNIEIKNQEIKDRLTRLLRNVLILVLLVGLFLQTPTFQWLKSISVMSVYSAYEASTSLLKDKGIQIKIPGGAFDGKRDWYPFVMTFNDDYGFTRYVDKEVRMSVLYNFAHFSPFEYQSDYYKVDSPYYNSFYGAYAASYEDETPFGFVDGQPYIEEMVLIPTYDMKHLVLNSIGSRHPVFDYEVLDSGKKVILEDEEWFYFDAAMTVSGSMHTYQKDYQAYIQYGRPPAVEVSPQATSSDRVMDYEEVQMYGRIYARYVEDKNITLFLYCIATDLTIVEEWEVNQMAETQIIIEDE